MDYAAQAIKAQTSIHKNGGPIQFVHVVPGTYDPITRIRTPGTPANTDIFAVVDETNKLDANTFVPSTLEYSRMRDLLISGLDLPDGLDQANDKFIFENTTWRIITFDLLSPDGITKILYTITVGA